MSSSIDQLRCYDSTSVYLPQMRYVTPAGYQDEEYLIPFSFTLPSDGSVARNLPIQMDDDVVFLWRSIIFPSAGLTIPVLAAPPQSGLPAMIGIRDTRGNFLTDGLVLTLGAWCQSGFGNNAYGFPLDVEVECDAGGVVLVDIQVPAGSGSGHASLTNQGIAERMIFTAVASGAAGNAVVINGINFGSAGPVTITVVGNTISITGGLTPQATYADVLAALEASGAAMALVTVSIAGSNPDEFWGWAFGESVANLSGGGSSFILAGNLAGVKRYPICVGSGAPGGGAPGGAKQ